VTFSINVVHKGREQAIGERRCGRCLRTICHDEHELVAADTRKKCPFCCRLQTTGDLNQHSIADYMSVGVIGLFETIKVARTAFVSVRQSQVGPDRFR